MKTLKTSTSVLAALLALSCAGQATAVTVAPGATVSLPGTTELAEPYLAGTVLLDESFSFSLRVAPGSTDMITGKVQQRVIREDGTGFLDFAWRITDVAGGPLAYFRIGNFNSSTFDANYRIDGLGDVGPSSVYRFDGGISNYVNFNFTDASGNGTLNARQTSKFFFLHTTATDYNHSAMFDVASQGYATTSQLFGAVTPVPEPETYAMLMAGLGLIGVMARRRKA